eukprot:4785544-Amphidinium_carterae.1
MASSDRGATRKQVLWLMSQQVRAERAVCSKQVVATGWSRLCTQECTYEQRQEEIEVRERTISKQIKSCLGAKATFEAIHATRQDRLMPVSIITVATRDMAMQLVKWTRDHPMKMVGTDGEMQERKVSLRPQIAEFD